MQKHREHEIEKIVGQLDGRGVGTIDDNDGSVEYLLFVILPVIGLIGLLSVLRRRFLN